MAAAHYSSDRLLSGSVDYYGHSRSTDSAGVPWKFKCGLAALAAAVGFLAVTYPGQSSFLSMQSSASATQTVRTAAARATLGEATSRPVFTSVHEAPVSHTSGSLFYAAPSKDLSLSGVVGLSAAVVTLGAVLITRLLGKQQAFGPIKEMVIDAEFGSAQWGMAAGTGRKSKSQEATEYVMQMPGILPPTGFFDPAGLSRMKTPAQLKYAREAELKHGRVAMLAALGFPFAEEFHPIFPEDSVPSDFAFQLTPLQTYWPIVVLAVGALESFSIATFKNLPDGTWELKENHINGNLGFDPLKLRPTDPEKYARMQNKELSNGRLAMIGIAGMVAQELVVRMDILKQDELDIEMLEQAVTNFKSLAMM